MESLTAMNKPFIELEEKKGYRFNQCNETILFIWFIVSTIRHKIVFIELFNLACDFTQSDSTLLARALFKIKLEKFKSLALFPSYRPRVMKTFEKECSN